MSIKLNNLLSAEVVLHNQRMLSSFEHWTKRKLLQLEGPPVEMSEALFEAPFAVVSHGIESDPIFKYGNRKALELFEMSWEDFTKMPSRNSAEPMHRDERAKFMEQVTKNGFVDDYEGIRVSNTGRRFLISNAVVWNVLDEKGKYCGQAAMFAKWEYLSPEII